MPAGSSGLDGGGQAGRTAAPHRRESWPERPESPSGKWDLEQLPDSSNVGASPEETDSVAWVSGVGEGLLAPVGDRDAAAVDGGEAVRAPHWLEESGRGMGWWGRMVPDRFRGARVDPGRRGVMTLALVGLITVVVATVVVFRERPVAQAVPPVVSVRASATSVGVGVPPDGSATGKATAAGVDAVAAPGSEAVTGELIVSVVGLVHSTGLVRLPAGSRVADAIAAAGGVREGADLTTLNLAQRLGDGDQVLVGSASPDPGPAPLGSTTITAGGRVSTAPKPPSGSTGPTGRVNLNTATEADLDALPGVGPVTARAIIAWRSANGRFTDIEQLGDIDGIGPTRLGRLRELVTI
ncbi:ComEA family DNA-binding protein [Nocardia sp. NPDC005366]|uniref:ComEA family DNA-binding protein n=1 Tax=Nocardia sp. NPDC005366 TaxID=3156878 RepID=UPI0033BF2873